MTPREFVSEVSVYRGKGKTGRFNLQTSCGNSSADSSERLLFKNQIVGDPNSRTAELFEHLT